MSHCINTDGQLSPTIKCMYMLCSVDVYCASTAKKRTRPLSSSDQSRARLCTSSAYQPKPGPPHDVTPSLEVQWRYRTITAAAFRGARLYYVANVAGRISSRLHETQRRRGGARRERHASSGEGDITQLVRAMTV